MSLQVIDIYTDGSCHPQLNIGAWAAIIFANDNKIILKDIARHTTHNRMELTAAIKAIDYAVKKTPTASIIIFTDSQYVCRITERKEKLKVNSFLSKKGIPLQNSDLVKLLIHQIETYPIKFVKVKAHQRIDNECTNTPENYNSEVDQLARQLVREEVKLLMS